MSKGRKLIRSGLLLAGAVSVLTLAVYFRALQNDFVGWDDETYVVTNTHIRSLDAAFFKWAFFDFYEANWHPLTWISHALDYAVWGLNPLGHHLTNVILHAINTFLVVLLVMRLTEAGRRLIENEISPNPSLPKRGTGASPPLEKGDTGGFSDKSALIAAGITGLLFGLHPLHVESVAWVAERKDLLCAFFFLLSIMAYLSYATHRTYKSYKTYFLSLLLFVLALMSKPMAVSLPLVLLILDWYPLERVRSLKAAWTTLGEKVPFIVLSIASSLVTVKAQASGGALASAKVVPFSERLPVAFASLVSYIGKMILPLRLFPFYPYPKDASILSPKYLSAAILVLVITAACAMFAGKRKFLPAAWSYYVITLIPVLGIVQVGGQSMADRYTYLPCLGPFFIAGLGAAWAFDKAGSSIKGSRTVVATAAVLILLGLSYLTFIQIGIWKNALDLWNYTIANSPQKAPVMYNNRGVALAGQGRIDEAAEDYRNAIALDPYTSEPHFGLGVAYERMGRYDEAIAEYKKAISLMPDFADAEFNLGAVYADKGMRDEAITHYRAALRLRPDFAMAHFNIGVIYLGDNRMKDAADEFESALRTDPTMDQARMFLEYARRTQAK